MKGIVIVGFVLATVPEAYGGQQSLDAAKDLYASAAYEEALVSFSRMYEDAAADVKRQIDEYRTFCLYALGRTSEAESVAESLIRTNPLMQLSDGETSPRIEAMFSAVRKRLLPDLIRDEYRAARASREARNSAAAESHLIAARGMLDEAKNIGAWSDALGELAELVDGFLDLARAIRPTAPANPSVASASSTRSMPTGTAVAPAPDRPAPAPAASAAVARSRGAGSELPTYDSSDRDVSPPVAISQTIPSPPRPLLEIMRATGRKGGKLQVFIDETGAVQDVVMRESVNSNYDEMLVSAARNWKFQPALRGGMPVRYLKVVNVTVSDR